MASSPPFPPNVRVSGHPCLRAKMSQLRSKDTNARETKTLVHEIALIVGCEALAAGLHVSPSGTGETPLGYSYNVETISTHLAIVPILRSGLGMLDAIQTLLPNPISIHHLGLFREPTTLQPVEYYNNLSCHKASSTVKSGIPEIAILIDPIIATGATAVAAIQTLAEWGVKKIIVISILGSVAGVTKAAEEWPEGVEIWIGASDPSCDERGMIKPGVGDVGDRLFLTIGK